jgi:uncharacterized protein YjbI with pentapeptide repeats
MNLDLSTYLAENPNVTSIADKNFEITRRVDLKDDIVFENCRFCFLKNSSFISRSLNFEKCVFIGKEELHEYKGQINIQFSECNLNNCRLSGNIPYINFSNCKLNDFKDTSISSQYVLNNHSYLKNFTINGECGILNLDSTVFNSAKFKGIWDKKIIRNASCKKTIFDNSDVNPFYFATKCDDKKSLDLSNARLTDDWSRLRKNYTGMSLFIVFFLSILFFLPIITQSFFLLMASKIDVSLLQIDKITLAEYLFFGGKNGFGAVVYFIFTCALLVYNTLRIWMTLSIAKLREEEKFLSDSNFQLVSISPGRYQKQLIIEKILKILFWVSILYSTLKLKDTLLIEVPFFY